MDGWIQGLQGEREVCIHSSGAAYAVSASGTVPGWNGVGV